MDRRQGADHQLATAQWQGLRRLLEEAGRDHRVHAADGRHAGFGFYGERRDYLWRRGHSGPLSPSAAAGRGIARRKSGWRSMASKLRNSETGYVFSKARATPSSAAIRCWPDIAFAAAIGGHQQVGDLLGCRVISLELVDPRYYHLDTCFCPIAPGVAIYYPQAFDEYGQRALAKWWPIDSRRQSPKLGTSLATRWLSAARSSPTPVAPSCIANCSRGVTCRSQRRWASSSNRAGRRSASRCGWTARKPPHGRKHDNHNVFRGFFSYDSLCKPP